MRHAAGAGQPAPARSWLAKLVIGTSVVVAFASSPPPRWHAEEMWSQRVFLEDRPERAFLLTVELDGELYADAYAQDGSAEAIASRAASDMTLSVRRLTPPAGPEAPDAGAPSGPSGAPDAGARAGTSDPLVRYPSPGAANRVWVPFDIECAERDRGSDVVRPERCVERFELRLARASSSPLSAEVRINVAVHGELEDRPPGTFQLRVEELPP